MGEKKVALIEYAGSHDECLLTQMRALKSVDAQVIWVTSTAMYERCTYLHEYVDQVYLIDFKGKSWYDFQQNRKLVQFLLKNHVQKIVCNTAQGGNIRNLSLMIPRSISCYGIIHTIRKFYGSYTQSIINKKFKKYAVLSDDLLKHTILPEGLSVQSFYPVEFPHYPISVEKPEGEVWITLTGGVETRRKDLSAMMEIVEQTPKHVRFIFLGKTDLYDPDAMQFIYQLEEAKQIDRIVWFENFVAQETFDSYLQQTDFLLPLIHPDTPSAEQYISNQISGAFLISFSYHIPLLIHHSYETEADLRKSAFFYHIQSFYEALDHAIENRANKAEQIANTEKWNPEFQHRNYLRFTGFIQ